LGKYTDGPRAFHEPGVPVCLRKRNYSGRRSYDDLLGSGLKEN